MASRVRQISIKESYEILGLKRGATFQDVKSAYRRKAFELHPDLHPDNPEAGRLFQRVNEAYVALSSILKPAEETQQKPEEKAAGPTAEETRAKAEAKAEEKRAESAPHAEEQKSEETREEKSDKDFQRAHAAYAEQDVLRDLLNDPFARRVFEDIYSELSKKQEKTEQEKPREEPRPEPKKPQPKPKAPQQVLAPPLNFPNSEKGVTGMVKKWLIKQLDDEQSLTMPAAALFPGRKIRLQIRPRPNDAVNSVEITLPRDFVVGKPMRLRGLGKRLGPWQGDLYLTIYTK